MSEGAMSTNEKISIVVPCYNEEAVLNIFYCTLKKIMENDLEYDNYELLFVNDGSKDDTEKILVELSKQDEHVQYLTFSRNFGKESAMYAGLQYADGDYTVIMDADLQHPPEAIVEMYREMKTGKYDMIATRRKNRNTDTKIRAALSLLFYKIVNKISGINMGDNALDFRMFNKKAKNAILSMAEYNRFSKGIFEWIGFRTYWLEVEIADRAAGESKWSIKSLFRYSLEGCIAFSTIPLALSSVCGLLFCSIAIIIILVMAIEALIHGSTGTGYATIICTILIVGGVQLFCFGILGQYLSKAYLEIKRRPKFLLMDMSDKKKSMYNEVQ